MIKEITIQSTFNKEEFIKDYTQRWKLDNVRRRKSLKTTIIFTTILLSMGIMIKADNGNDNFILVIGCASLFLTLILISSYRKVKKDFFSKLQSEASRFESIQNNTSISISDKSIKYQDREKSMEVNWEVFKKYTIDDDCIFLMFSDLYTNAYTIDKKDCDDDTFQEIIKLVQSKIPSQAYV